MPLRYTHDFGRLARVCSGRALMPDPRYADNLSNVTLALIVMPVCLWYGFEWEYMWDLSMYIPIGVGALFALSLFMLACAMLTEPGIIKHQPGPASPGSGRRELLVSVGDRVMPLAEANRAPHLKRAKYCKQIECVVERFDHFCPWVGNAIGLRNYRYFLFFVTATTLLCLAVFGACVARIYLTMRDRGLRGMSAFLSTAFSLEASGALIVCTLLMLYCFFVSLLMLGLSAFHLCLLVRTAETTNEYLKAAYDETSNPHNRGCCANYATVLCTHTPRSHVVEWVGKDGDRSTPLARADSLSNLEGGEGAGAGDVARGGSGGGGTAGGGCGAGSGGGSEVGCLGFGRGGMEQARTTAPVPASALEGPSDEEHTPTLIDASEGDEDGDGGTPEAVAHYHDMTRPASFQLECDGEHVALSDDKPKRRV